MFHNYVDFLCFALHACKPNRFGIFCIPFAKARFFNFQIEYVLPSLIKHVIPLYLYAGHKYTLTFPPLPGICLHR